MSIRRTAPAIVLAAGVISSSVASTAWTSPETRAPMLRPTSLPPSGTTWWYRPKPYGPGTIVGVRRKGDRIQFVDNWSPCFTGVRVRGNVYRGGGKNQNSFYSAQEMKIWISGGKLRFKRAFIPEERIWKQRTWSIPRRITVAEVRRLLDVKPSQFWDCWKIR